MCWMCHKWVHIDDMELDHIISRSRRPDLRYVHSNLAPSCHDCNTKKGSKEFIAPVHKTVEIEDIWSF